MIDIKELENKIINADCMDILKQLPDKCIDLVLTDPPYGIGESKGKNKSRVKLAIAKDYGNKDWDSKIPQKEVFDEIIRISKHAIIFGGNYFVEYLKNSPCWIVWDKLNTGNFADCELAWTSFKSAVRKYEFLWNGMIQQNMKNKEVRIHPTQKPADLFGMILRDYSKEGDLILDCFSGSGTTAIACHRLKRRFICIERDKDYWQASVKRLEDEQRQGVLL
jgi:site-specific DNA-methyltransferase (adenine-specific)